MSGHQAAILIVARDNPAALWAQIEALVACDLPEDVEVVVVDDASGPETRALLARLEGDVTIHRTDRPIGRRAALAAAAQAASAEVCIALAHHRPAAARVRRAARRGRLAAAPAWPRRCSRPAPATCTATGSAPTAACGRWRRVRPSRKRSRSTAWRRGGAGGWSASRLRARARATRKR